MIATKRKPVRKPKGPKCDRFPEIAEHQKFKRRKKAIAAEIDRLRVSNYGADIGGWVTRHNGRKLTIEEAAALNVDRAKEFAANVRGVCQSRQFPATHGNEVQTRAAGTLADQYKHNPRKLKQIVAAAKSRGYSPSDCDQYMEPFEALYGRGDPRCFVKQQDGRHYVRNVIKSHGLGNEGLAGDFDCAPVDPEKTKPKIKPRRLKQLVTREILEKPELKSRPVAEIAEKVIADRTFDD